jgi:hypothetical protein
VRATETLLQQVDCALGFVHQQRRAALFRGVRALIAGGALWLSALGRAIDDPLAHRHAIKAIDRLLGNRALHRHRVDIYAALSALLLRRKQRVVVLVDITEIRPGICALTASVAMDGRSVPIYDQVRSKKTIQKTPNIRAFLRALQRVLTADVRPVLVTDAGFESPWFDQVVELGWDFVGRVRHQTKFLIDGDWVGVKALHRLAISRARCLGWLPFPRHRPCGRRLVLSARPQPKGRTRKTARGRRGRTHNDRRCAKSAREPWLLATSLHCSSDAVVAIYAQRMQIEQNYRDTKNHRWGWRFDQSRSRSNERLQMLLLIAAIATFVVLAFGCLAEKLALHKRYQANTLYRRRVLSFFTLGLFVVRDRYSPLWPSPTTLLHEFRTRIFRWPALR